MHTPGYPAERNESICVGDDLREPPDEFDQLDTLSGRECFGHLSLTLSRPNSQPLELLYPVRRQPDQYAPLVCGRAAPHEHALGFELLEHAGGCGNADTGVRG